MIYRQTLIQLPVIVFAQSILLVGKRHTKTMFLRQCQRQLNQQCLKRGNLEIAWDYEKKNNQFNLDESIDINVENKSELSLLKYEIECLKEKLHEKDVEMQEQKLIADIEIARLKEQLTFTSFVSIDLNTMKHTTSVILDLKHIKYLIYLILLCILSFSGI